VKEFKLPVPGIGAGRVVVEDGGNVYVDIPVRGGGMQKWRLGSVTEEWAHAFICALVERQEEQERSNAKRNP
jgi:hypothetical protein